MPACPIVFYIFYALTPTPRPIYKNAMRLPVTCQEEVKEYSHQGLLAAFPEEAGVWVLGLGDLLQVDVDEVSRTVVHL